MRSFEYNTPTHVVFGKDSVEKVGALVAEQGCKKVLIHYGGGSAKRSGLLDRVSQSLDASGVAYVMLGGVVPNPRLSLVREGIDLCRKEGVDFILAVGGGSRDVTDGIKKYGIVPTEVYPGLCYGTDLPDFTEIDRVVKGYMDAVIAGDKLTTAWQRGLDAVLDAYLGPKPEKFTWKGKEYTPQSFAASLGLDMDDYVEISSYTHHPFYEEFILEVPDNWMWGTVWNLPLDEMMAVVDNALANDYTVLWGTDVSEKGFSRTKAIGIVPEADLTSMSGTDAERWGKLSDKEKEAALYKFDKPGKERVITQQMRQEAFDNYETTDDHGMQIMGTAVDQAGNDYYKVKNSWGVRPPYDGYYYFSRPFVAYKTMSVMVNKKAIPAPIRKKMGL